VEKEEKNTLQIITVGTKEKEKIGNILDVMGYKNYDELIDYEIFENSHFFFIKE